VNSPGINASQDFATYSPGIGIIAFTNYKTTLAAAGPADIVKLSVTESVPANKTIAAMVVANGATANLGTSTLTIGSGAIAFANGGSVLGNTLSFGGSEGIVVTTAGTVNVNANLAGTQGLTLAGPGQFNLNMPTTYTGGTTLNQGTFNIASAASLG